MTLLTDSNHSRLRIINNRYFNGVNCFTIYPGIGIQVNTDIIPTYQVPPMHAVVVITHNHPGIIPNASASAYRPPDVVEAYAVPMNSTYSQPIHENYVKPAVSPMLAGDVIQETVVATQPRIMSVTIPDDAVPGATIRVMSPDGVQVAIQIPHDASPGKQIRVQY